MKQLSFLCLLVLCSCATRVEMSRLASSQSPGVPNLASYSHLVVAKPTGGMEAASAIQSTIIEELYKSKYFFIENDTNFQDGPEKLPLLLNSEVKLQKREEPIKTGSLYNPFTKRNETVSTRNGAVQSLVRFKLCNLRAPEPSLYEAEKNTTKVAYTSGYGGIAPAEINYAVLAGQGVQECVSDLVKDLFPHYETTYYWIFACPPYEEDMKAGIGYFSAKDYAKAEAACRRILDAAKEKNENRKRMSQAYFLLGLSLEAQGKFDDAIKMYDAAIERKPEQKDFFHARQCAIKAKETYAKLSGGSPPPPESKDVSKSKESPAGTEIAKPSDEK